MKAIPYGTQYIDEDDIASVIKTLKSDFMTQGPKVKEFEDKVASYHDCKYAVSFCNGTSALHGAYYASGIKKNDEFITTPITFVASANCGLYMGARPVFVDIDKNDHNIDITKIHDAINDKTRVITPVSYGGYPAKIKEIFDMVKGKDIVIIHDAAHAIGARRDGYNICDFADMAMISFHPVKHVATGEGGIILTNNEEYYKKLILFRSHGITKNRDELLNYDGPWYYDMIDLGFNYRLTDIQCALGISQMDKLDSSLYKRNQIADRYDKELCDIEWLKIPKYSFDKSWLQSQQDLSIKPNNLNSYHLYSIQIREKNRRLDFFNYLRENNIFVQVHYIPITHLSYYKKTFGYIKDDFPNAEEFYEREISIPMFPSLSEDEQDYVIGNMKKYT